MVRASTVAGSKEGRGRLKDWRESKRPGSPFSCSWALALQALVLRPQAQHPATESGQPRESGQRWQGQGCGLGLRETRGREKALHGATSLPRGGPPCPLVYTHTMSHRKSSPLPYPRPMSRLPKTPTCCTPITMPIPHGIQSNPLAEWGSHLHSPYTPAREPARQHKPCGSFTPLWLPPNPLASPMPPIPGPAPCRGPRGSPRTSIEHSAHPCADTPESQPGAMSHPKATVVPAHLTCTPFLANMQVCACAGHMLRVNEQRACSECASMGVGLTVQSFRPQTQSDLVRASGCLVRC